MNEGDLIESEESQRRREAILVATRGAKRGWQNLAVVALQAAARWKRERDELLWLHAEAAWQRDEARNRFLDHYNATSDQMDRIASLEQALRDRVAERDGLQARINDTIQVVSVADAEDITDWQRGYRACFERATKFLLGGSESGGN